MAYITNANFRRITRELNVPKDKNFKFDDIIIWESPNGKTIDKNNPSIFGWWEVNDLLAFKEFCKDAKMAVNHFYCINSRLNKYTEKKWRLRIKTPGNFS